MSNSPLVSYTKISPNRSSPRTHKIDTITIHCVVGQCTVETLGNVFAPTSKRASCNYGIGYDGKIGMYVEEKDRSWCSSSRSNDDRSITIEVASDTEHPYAVTDEAYAALIDLCEDICRRNGIKKLLWKGNKSLVGQVDKQNMTVHRWFANKACPGDYLYNRHSQIAEAVNARLENQEEDDDMTQEKFNEMLKAGMAAYRTELQDNDCGTWSEEDRQWAIDAGLIKGSSTEGDPNYMWADFLTREQAIALLHRLFEMMK